LFQIVKARAENDAARAEKHFVSMLLLILGAGKMMALFFSCKLIFPSSSKRWIYKKGIIRKLSDD
jgi:hypothetical protein